MIAEVALSLLSPIVTAGGAWWLARRGSKGPTNSTDNEELQEINRIDAEITEMIPDFSKIISQEALRAFEDEFAALQSEHTSERETLRKIETTLEGAQKDVEQKELEQQELKISQKEDEQRSLDLQVQFNQINEESKQLELNLEDSLKDLSELVNELEEGSKLRVGLEELSRSVEDAASLLRELFLEYKAVNERVQMIANQQRELEEEYTRLVEQQLSGE